MDGSILGQRLLRTTEITPRPARRSDGVTARLVIDDDETFREALALRYEAYVAAGYLAPRSEALFSDTHDNSSLSKTVVLYNQGEPAASVRVCMLGHRDGNERPGDLPAAAMFRHEIDTCLDGEAAGGRRPRAVEITRLACSPHHARDITLLMGLYHIVGYLILHFRADIIFAAVTVNHAPFYRRMGFREIAPARDYPGLDVQTLLMGCRTSEHRGIPGKLMSLAEISLSDDTYLGLVTGQPVPVFGERVASRQDLVVNKIVGARAIPQGLGAVAATIG